MDISAEKAIAEIRERLAKLLGFQIGEVFHDYILDTNAPEIVQWKGQGSVISSFKE